jgi:hypothetical protein
MQIMSSSISGSDPRPVERPAAERAWARFALTFALGAAIVLALLLGVAYAIDPYDTGRGLMLQKPGVRPQIARTAAASRGRDPSFDAAIVGNSHIMLLSPDRLGPATGLSFVQLTLPATQPKEHLAVIDWFLRHRPAPQALVIGADFTWCTGDPELTVGKPFPFWLFAENPLEYLRGLLRQDTLEEIPRRIGYALARNPERARPDGYWDYEIHYDPPTRDLARVKVGTTNLTGRFPAAERLRERLARVPPELAVVALFPPVYRTMLPESGTPAAEADRQCKQAIREAVAVHPRSATIDWRVDRPENRLPENYMDHTHYRKAVAVLVEADLAAALALLRRRPDVSSTVP